MQKEGEVRITGIRDKKGLAGLTAFSPSSSCVSSRVLSLPKRGSFASQNIARLAPFPILLFVMIIFYAALVFAQSEDAQDTGSKEVIIEQVVGDNAPVTGFVAKTSEPHEDSARAKTDAPPSVWTASDVMLILLLTVVVVLFGYVLGTYHRQKSGTKGTVGMGPASKTRIVQTSRAFAASARSHARSVHRFFSRRMKLRMGTAVGRELESYLKHRQEPARLWSANKPAQRGVSSYEDEYWQRQKEQFWSRVKRAADRIENTPKAIQQLAVKQVQQYNEAMAQVRQAKEDLYEAAPAKEGSAAAAQDLGKPASISNDHEASVSRHSADSMSIPQSIHNPILNQLKEAHSV